MRNSCHVLHLHPLHLLADMHHTGASSVFCTLSDTANNICFLCAYVLAEGPAAVTGLTFGGGGNAIPGIDDADVAAPTVAKFEMNPGECCSFLWQLPPCFRPSAFRYLAAVSGWYFIACLRPISVQLLLGFWMVSLSYQAYGNRLWLLETC